MPRTEKLVWKHWQWHESTKQLQLCCAGVAQRPRGNITTQAPSLQLPSILPPQVAQQIRTAQQKAALLGQAPAVWAIGSRCQVSSFRCFIVHA